jgi:S-methylmethionine-dependent homocysteine/selenocysteine methylase
MEGALRNTKLQPCPFTSPEIVNKIINAKLQGAKIEAFGFNCASPEDIYIALQTLKLLNQITKLRNSGIKIIAYANCNDRKNIHEI